MTTVRAKNLLIELYRLLSKYSDSEIESLISSIESGEATKLLLQLVKPFRPLVSERRYLQPSNASRKNKTKTPKKRLEDFVRELETQNSENAKKVRSFIGDVIVGRTLPNARTLKEFSKRLGISVDSNFDRQIAIRRIGEFLIEQPSHRVDEHTASARQMLGEKSSLQAWSKIINKDTK